MPRKAIAATAAALALVGPGWAAAAERPGDRAGPLGVGGAAALASTGGGADSAVLRPDDRGTLRGPGAVVSPVVIATAVPATADGFDWTDAAIGALGAIVVVVLGERSASPPFAPARGATRPRSPLRALTGPAQTAAAARGRHRLACMAERQDAIRVTRSVSIRPDEIDSASPVPRAGRPAREHVGDARRGRVRRRGVALADGPAEEPCPREGRPRDPGRRSGRAEPGAEPRARRRAARRELADALHVERQRRPTRPSAAARERRLESKRRRAAVKRNRATPSAVTGLARERVEPLLRGRLGSRTSTRSSRDDAAPPRRRRAGGRRRDRRPPACGARPARAPLGRRARLGAALLRRAPAAGRLAHAQLSLVCALGRRDGRARCGRSSAREVAQRRARRGPEGCGDPAGRSRRRRRLRDRDQCQPARRRAPRHTRALRRPRSGRSPVASATEGSSSLIRAPPAARCEASTPGSRRASRRSSPSSRSVDALGGSEGHGRGCDGNRVRESRRTGGSAW